MRCEIRIAGRTHTVEVERESSRLCLLIDGRALEADAAEVSPDAFSVLLGGRSYEARVAPSPDGSLKIQIGSQEFAANVEDPRAWRGRRGLLEAEGRQQILAPMPGKVIRVLVREGEKVESGQGLLVVEAMKMQNEIQSPKSGVVERLLAAEGQAVNAGEVLAWVE